VAASGQAPGTFNVRRIVNSNFPSEFICTISPATADAALAAGDYYMFGQKIEGYNCAGFNWGHVNGRSITISFYVLGTSAMVLPISVRNSAIDRTWLGSFSVSTGWTKKTINIPADTSGVWLADNGIGLNVQIGLGIGTTYHGVAGWQAGNFLGLAGMTNIMAVGGGTVVLSLRDFQVEIGDVATEFERVPYDEQLARCQRYYQVMGETNLFPVISSGYAAAAAATIRNTMAFPVSMRAVPTAVKAGTWLVANCGQPAIGQVGANGVTLAMTATATGDAYSMPNSADDLLTFSAEL